MADPARNPIALPSPTVFTDLASQGVVVVEERALRRIVKLHYKLPGIGLQVPHTSCLALTREALARVVEDEVVPSSLPDRVVVVAADPATVTRGDAATMSALWRNIFHARVHEAFDKLGLTNAAIRTRVRQIGQTEFDEIRHVLLQESLLLPPVDDLHVYIELAATYLELRHFAPHALDRTFPAAHDRDLDTVIAQDVDAAAILAASRPPRAPDQPMLATLVEEEPTPLPEIVVPSAAKAASAARAKGNRARAAILAARAGDLASARIDLDELVARLAKDLGAKDTAGWAEALLLVARSAGAQGARDPAARLLQDLQTACIVAEREVKAVDVIGWALSRGKRAAVRPLPATRDLEMVRRVRKAANKVALVQLGSREDRTQLADAMHAISAAGDERMRVAYRPIIVQALHAVGLEPHSIPDRVAEKTLVDELLDRAVTVGRLTLGDLRDALSRNDLKLPDLALADLRAGDPLLRADTILSTTLDGVHRRGETYMRWLQRISSVLFGTMIGRFLTRYALLPLLGAFALVEGLQHMIAPFAGRLGYTVHISSRTTLLATAGFLFLVIHIRPLRAGLWYALTLLWRLLRATIWDLPRLVLSHPIVRAVLRSVVGRWLFKPAVPAAIAWYFARPLGVYRWAVAGAVFVAIALVVNTRFVRRMEELVIDWLVRSGRQLGRAVPGLVKLTLQVFAKLVDLLERGLYRVDEWLRFRKGESAILIPLKGIVGTVWFFVTYVLRLYVNLFVEPTINPIKHFPVVTVAAKIILPFIPSMLSGITDVAKPLMGSGAAKGFAGFTVLVLPGLAGFLVWELKENWRLYKATRPKMLQPIIIGSHGETMSRLLRPGFHSGTIPKLFTKLRRAAWRDDLQAVARAKEGLHHVEEGLVKFVERQLASLLAACPAFGATDIHVRDVHIASNRIDIVLACPSIAKTPATMRIELAGRWLVAGIPVRGWIAEVVDDRRRRILETALAGFYKLAAIDIVREQIEHALSEQKPVPAFDIADEGLIVWPRGGYETEVAYNLMSRRLKRTVRGEPLEGETPALAGKHVLFSKQPIYWSVWATSWNRFERDDVPLLLHTGPSVLPL